MIKVIIKDLVARATSTLAEHNQYMNAIKALQRTCTHEWVNDGHGHRQSYYKCDICGMEKWE